MELQGILLRVCLYFLTGKTISGAEVTQWTEPVIFAKDGTAGVAALIMENLADGSSTGITLSAIGANRYELASATSNGVTFSIHVNSGLLTKESGTLDYETNIYHVIVALAIGDTTTGTATVTLTVNDVNEPPVFATANALVTIYDGSGPGTAVHTVAISQADNTIAAYSITGGNTNSDFTISDTGEITVAAMKILRSGSTPYYFLQVEVNDASSPSLTGTTTIAVGVILRCAATNVAVSMTTIALAIILMSLN